MPSPQSPPNPFARPSPWGNTPPVRIRVEGRAPPPPAKAPQRPQRDSRTVMLSGFSAPPPPRPRPAAPPPAQAEAVPQQAWVEETASASPFPAPIQPHKARRGVPATVIVAGGFVLSVVAGLGVAAISLTRSPPAGAPPPAVTAALSPPAVAAAAEPAPPTPPAAEVSILPERVADPAIQQKRAVARAAIARTPAAPKPAAQEPAAPDTAPLLAVPPAAPAIAPTPLFGPAPVRAAADPEAPIPTRTRAPD